MNTRVTIGRGRTLEEYKLGAALTLFHRAPEHVLLSPHLKDVAVHLCQVQSTMLGKFLHFIALIYFIHSTLFILH